MKYVFILIILTQIASCAMFSGLSSKSNDVEVAVRDSDNLENTNEPIDSTYEFKCGKWTQKITPKKINWVNFNDDLSDCLVLEGFNGNTNANKQIALIVRSISRHNFFVFGQDPKFRGPDIFEALLSKANDHTPLFDPDVEDFRYITGTIGSGYRGLCQSMIKSIDGKSQSQWRIDLFYDYEIKNLEWDMETGLFNPAYGKEVGEKYYNALLKAWQEGKISLKNYGEE